MEGVTQYRDTQTPNGQKPETPEFLRLTMAGPRGAGGQAARPELTASGDNLAWLPSALQRTPCLCTPAPPAASAPPAALGLFGLWSLEDLLSSRSR